MPKSTIIFRVPQDFSALQGPIADFPGEVSGGGSIDYADLDNLDAQLRNLIGETIEIDFDEPDDPSAPIEAFVEALKNTDAPYLASHESYTEPSRGERFLGRILMRAGGHSEEKRCAWQDGEPEISDERSLRKAGFDERQIAAIRDTFFPDPAPSPRG